MLICGCLDTASGFGRVGHAIADTFIENGHDVKLVPKYHQGQVDLLKYAERIVQQKRWDVPDIFITPLSGAHFARGSRSVVTMWEASRLPAAYVDEINRIGSCFVPSSANVRWFRDSGYTGKLYRFQLGADATFAPLPDGPITFGTIGADNGVPERKQTWKVLKAFEEEFSETEPVRLVIKTNPSCSSLRSAHKGVTTINSRLSDEEQAELMKRIHVGVFPSAMEGWGLPANELMASGRPLILPYWGGYEDFTDKSFTEYLPFRLVPSPENVFRSVGERPDVEVQAIRNAMRKLYTIGHAGLQVMGEAAAKQATNFTVAKMKESFYREASNASSLAGRLERQTSI